MLGALVPLVVLYILKVKRERLQVSSTWLWATAQRDLLASSPFKRFVAQIPFILQALALILLSFALARPASRSDRIAGDHIAIVIDTSASMSAVDPSGKTRIDMAKQAASDIVDALGPGTDALIIDASRDPRIASPLERDRRRLKAAIDVLDAGHVQGDLQAAVALASDRMRQLGGASRLVVLTDGALATPDALRNVNLPLQVVRVGSAVENAAIVRFDVRSGLDPVLNRQKVQAFAMLANFGTRPRELFVTLAQSGASDVLASRKVLLQPGERAPVVLGFHPSTGDIGQGLVMQLSPPDAMAVDDIAYGKVPPGPQIPVVFATTDRPSPWLERALLADPNVQMLRAKSTNLDAVGIPAGALVVVDGACPKGLPLGDVLIVNPPPGRCLTATVGREVKTPLITSWATGDDRFRFLTLDGVFAEKAHLIDMPSEGDGLIRTNEGAIAADVSTPGRTATLLAFDVGDTNWPYKASFVLFARNLVELARAHRSRGVAVASMAGEPVRVAVPYQVEQIEVQYPDEKLRTIRARDGLAIVPDTDLAGIYHVSWGEPFPASVTFAVNLTSEAESDIREKPLDVSESAAKITDASNLSTAHVQWSWLLGLLAFTLILIDVWYITRKPKLRATTSQRPRLPKRPARPARSVS